MLPIAIARPAHSATTSHRITTSSFASTMPAQNRPPVLMMTLHIWALSHGIASLFGRGDGARHGAPISPEDLLEAAVLIYLRGLGLPDASVRGG